MPSAAALWTVRDQSLGSEMMLNLGATGELPIRHSSISRPNALIFSSVCSLSQSSAARCSSVKRWAIHTIVTAFGHEQPSVKKFNALNDTYYEGAWRAQYATGIMFPIMMFVGNLGYVAVAVIGGILVTRRAIALGDVQAFIQYSRQFSMPITQLSSMANTIQLTIASAERVFELLDEAEEPEEPSAPEAPKKI